MKLVQRVETFDGRIHDNTDAALHHLQVLHGNLLSKIAHALVAQERYTKIGNWVDENLDLFADLHHMKRDMILQNPPEDD